MCEKKRILPDLAILLPVILPLLFSIPVLETCRNVYIEEFNPSESVISGVLPPAVGTWNITTDTTISGENLLLNGSIDVKPGITLSIFNSQIEFSNDSSIIYMYESNLHVENASLSNFTSVKFAIGGNGTFSNASFSSFSTGLYGFQANITASNCTFNGGYRGFHLVWCQHAIITGCYVVDIEEKALLLDGSDACYITNNTFRGSGFDWECVGLFGQWSSGVIVENNTFLNFHKSFFLSVMIGTIVTRNYFAQTQDSVYEDGEIQFTYSNNTIFEHNVARNLTYDGLELYRCYNFSVQYNQFFQVPAGLHFDQGTWEVEARHNTFVDSTLLAFNCDAIRIYDNTITGGSASLVNVTRAEIVNNVICGDPVSIENCPGIINQGNTYPCGTDGDDYPWALILLAIILTGSIAIIVTIAITRARKKRQRRNLMQ